MNQTEKNFLRYLDLVQVTLSHLLQDGDIVETGVEAVRDLLSTTEDLQRIYEVSSEK